MIDIIKIKKNLKNQARYNLAFPFLQLLTSLITIFFLFGGKAVYGQNMELVLADTLNTEIADSATLRINENLENRSEGQIDTCITYSAENMQYFKRDGEDRFILSGEATLNYQGKILTAEVIEINFATEMVYAHYREDTVFQDKEQGIVDSIIILGLPSLVENGQIVTGKSMIYNLKSGEGKVENARTILPTPKKNDNTYFSTEQMIKLDNNEINGMGVKITSCNLDNPHYYFKADSAIVTKDDWVFAKPITLYFSKVPVGWFPFILYKNNRGRKSGLILPAYSYRSSKGNGLEHLGFFWDINDYMDYKIMADYYDRGGYLLEQTVRYKKKYDLDGILNFDYKDDHESRDWRLEGSHNQIFTPTTKLKADYEYVSSRSLVDELGDTSLERMKNKLNSGGTFSKRWNNSGDNLKLMASYTQYVDTAIVKYTFPSFSYNLTGRKPFKGLYSDLDLLEKFQISGSTSITTTGEVYDDKNILTKSTSYGISLNQSSYIGEVKLSSSQKFSGVSFKGNVFRSDWEEEQYTYSNKPDSVRDDYGLKTSSSLSYKHNFFKYFRMEESLNTKNDLALKYYDENWEYQKGKKWRNMYDFTTTVNTNIYGMFQPELPFVRKIRHTITPSLAYTYHPDFSDDSFGYFQDYINSDSTVTKKDIFASSMIGTTPKGEFSTISFSLKNRLEAKVFKNFQKPEKGTKNRDLFTLDFGGSYNFAADSNKLSLITSKFRSTLYNGSLVGKLIGLRVGIDAGATFSPYGAYDKPLYDENNPFSRSPLRFQKYDYTYSLTLPLSFDGAISEKQFTLKALKETIFGFEDDDEGEDDDEEEAEQESEYININRNLPYRFTDMKLNIGGSFYFSEKKSFESNFSTDLARYIREEGYVRNMNMNLTASLSPTENWLIEYQSTFNFLKNSSITSTTVTVSRDVHCWEGLFEWDLFQQGYKLTINVKSSVFSDLKYEKDAQKQRW